MLQAERQNEILDYLKKNGRATTVELSEMLGVSTTTIRNDLNQMDKDGFLTKIRLNSLKTLSQPILQHLALNLL